MYTAHFGFTEKPFGLTPNTAFFLNVKGHRDAFNMLRVALANDEGFMKIVGEVGTGKTMLCRKLLNALSGKYISAYIPNPFLNPTALYRAIAKELGIKSKARDGVHEYLQDINARLIDLVGAGKKVVLVIDEAQSMPPKTLEALRLISNLETETSKLVHIVLFGQPELDRLLDHSSLRQLRQRISFSYELPPLSEESTSLYVNHRLAKAGYNGEPLFDNAALDLIYRVSQGVPRLVNILSHKALISAYGKGDSRIRKQHIQSAVNDTQGVELPSRLGPVTWGVSVFALTAAVAMVLFILPGALF